MSGWGVGVRMNQDPTNPFIFLVKLVLPFTFEDACALGMFQFRYEIVTPTGEIVPEGQGERTENRIRPHFFHSFRPDYLSSRFRNVFMVTVKDAFQGFVQREIALLKIGHITAKEALSRFVDLLECMGGGVARMHVEEIFEDEIQVCWFHVTHQKCFYAFSFARKLDLPPN